MSSRIMRASTPLPIADDQNVSLFPPHRAVFEFEMHACHFAGILHGLREIVNRLGKCLHKIDALLREIELDHVSNFAHSDDTACYDFFAVPTLDYVFILTGAHRERTAIYRDIRSRVCASLARMSA